MAAVCICGSDVMVKNRDFNGPPFTKSKTANLQPEPHSAGSDSKSNLPKPLTPSERQAVVKKTSTLIRKRNELDRALLRLVFPPLNQLNADDRLPRENILRECERLARMEQKYIRLRTRDLEKRTALYNQHPAQERALDLELIRTQLCKFKRHLGPYLGAAENLKGIDGGPSTSSEDAGGSNSGRLDKEKSTVGLDGAFDDTRNQKKRKRASLAESEKESQKKARKEQTPSDKDSTSSQGQSDKHTTPKRSKEMVATLAEIINNMSQTKDCRLNGIGQVKVEEKAIDTRTIGTSDKAERGAFKTSASSTSDDKVPVPFYRRHAKAMLRPDFDDLVYDRPAHRRRPKLKQNRGREYLVHGAIPVFGSPGPKRRKTGAHGSSTDGP